MVPAWGPLEHKKKNDKRWGFRGGPHLEGAHGVSESCEFKKKKKKSNKDEAGMGGGTFPEMCEKTVKTLGTKPREGGSGRV